MRPLARGGDLQDLDKREAGTSGGPIVKLDDVARISNCTPIMFPTAHQKGE